MTVTGPPTTHNPPWPELLLLNPAQPSDCVDCTYTHVQNDPAEVWTIEHPLDYYPSVTVVDSAGNQVEGDVTFATTSTIFVRFSAAFSGIAYLS